MKGKKEREIEKLRENPGLGPTICSQPQTLTLDQSVLRPLGAVPLLDRLEIFR